MSVEKYCDVCGADNIIVVKQFKELNWFLRWMFSLHGRRQNCRDCGDVIKYEVYYCPKRRWWNSHNSGVYTGGHYHSSF